MSATTEYLLFLARTATVVVAVLLVVAGIAAASGRGRAGSPRERLQVRRLNRHFDQLQRTLEGQLLPRRSWRYRLGELKGLRRARPGGDGPGRRRVFVLRFRGDLRASAVEGLREEVTAILTVARDGDEVLLRLDSAGGLVPAYGLAASQLVRLKDRGLVLIVAVDRVAASGGYMMACVADQILASPFAIVGSIGVVAQLPNFNRLLKRKDVDYELFTAGEHKRTVTMFGENTDKGRAKLQEEIEDAHVLFKEFIAQHRPAVDLARVATGEYWFATRALELKLVDGIRTSDDYLLAARDGADLLEVKSIPKRGLLGRIAADAANSWRRDDAL
jgi:serine protease SohB